jgi:uncharacterized delta-60 repeat protein
MNTTRSPLRIGLLTMGLLLPVAEVKASPGDPDLSFRSAVSWNMAFALQPDGKIVVAPYSSAIIRLNSDGTHDSSFNKVIPTWTRSGASSAAEVRAIVVQPDGRILIGGPFERINGVTRNRIARTEADGTLDASFDPNLEWVQVYAMAVQNDGKILAGGILTSVFVPEAAMVLFNPDGTMDESFVAPAKEVTALAVQLDGKILFGGFWDQGNGVLRSGIARLENDGSMDLTFNGARLGGFYTFPSSIALQQDGKIIIGGIFDSVTGVSRRGIARLNTDGSLDNSFDPGTGVNFERFDHGGWDGRSVASVAIQKDGKILIAGKFERVNGIARANVARLNPDGSVDLAFNPPATMPPRFGQIALQTDGKLLAGNGTSLIRLLTGEALPPLSIARSGEEMVLSWSTAAGSDAFLETSDSLVDPALWKREPMAPVIVGERFILPITSTARAQFYRLRRD